MNEIKASKDFNTAIKSGTVIADFYSTGCGNCKMLEPIMAQLENEYKDIKFIKINIENAQDLTEKYAVTSLPTLIFFKDGEAADKMTGLKPKTLIAKKIAEVF